jgi:hypothetical protein
MVHFSGIGRNTPLLVIAFECRYQRDASRPCNGVKSYKETDDDGYESPDEIPLGLRREIVENVFGGVDHRRQLLLPVAFVLAGGGAQ